MVGSSLAASLENIQESCSERTCRLKVSVNFKLKVI